MQGAWLQHDTARLAGTEECEYRRPGWAWTGSSCPKPIRTLPSLAMPPKKLVGLQCPCPIRPAVLAAQWRGLLGRDYGGECAGCFLSFPHEHQQLGMWDARLWGTLGFALLLPLLLEWEMEAIAGKEVGRSSCCGAGQAPQLPNPVAQSRVGHSSGAGAYTVPENHLHICLQLLCPPWICPPKAAWGDASVLLPARTFSPLLGRDGTSPGNLHNSRLAGEGQP